MKFSRLLIILAIIVVAGVGIYLALIKKPPTPVVTPLASVSPTPYPDTQSAIQAFLAKKYSRPISEVKVIVDKEVMGFAAGSVLFGQGGPGEGGMWLAVLGNGWDVVWDGNGNVDCTLMRQKYGFPDTILKPTFCK